MSKDKVILVTGATGQQGGAVARHLHADGWQVRALTRNPEKPQAQALAKMGIQVVKGDLADAAAVKNALKGVYGVFSVQQFWEHGFDGEVKQGILLAEAAKDAGVQHFVYSSVGGAERNTGIPHFDSKWKIEQRIHELKLPATIFRPVFFMENFTNFIVPQNGTLAWALYPRTRLQLLTVDDVGVFVAKAFAKPNEFIGKATELAGDELTLVQVAEAFTRVTAKEMKYVPIPMEEVHKQSEEVAVMLEWFNEKGYIADIPALRKLHPALMNFEAWLRKRHNA
jgi:uncharacterized protein YbjT (DUF2867 family)